MQKKQLRVLTIGAHPDDCELCTGGTCIKYSSLGHVVKYVYTTKGDAGHHKLKGEEIAKVRRQEIKDSCAVAGFDYEIMDNHDAYLEANIYNREQVIRIIRRFRPDIIFTHRSNDYHPDHRNTALLVQDASYLLMVPGVCPDTPILDYSPVIMYVADGFKKPSIFEPDVVVDIDDVMEEKVKMLHCHKSQMYEWLPWIGRYEETVPVGEKERVDWLYGRIANDDGKLADRFRMKLLEQYGAEKGAKIKFIEAFEVSEYGGELPEGQISVYFPFL